MRIGELSDLTGVSPRSLRYYEEQGLLVSTRTSGGQRVYPDSAVDRVNRIQALYQAGLNSSTIYEILPCMRDSDGYPSEIADVQLTKDLHRERDRILQQIAAQKETLKALDQVIRNADLDRTKQ